MRRLGRRAIVVAAALWAAAVPPGVLAQAAARGAPPAAGDTAASHRRAAERLLEVSGAERMFAGQADALLRQQLAAQPQLAPFEDVLRDFYRKHLDYATLKPDLVRLYVETFSEKDLDDMIAFYQTDLGRRMLAKLPEVQAKSIALSQQRLQAALPELMSAVRARMEELQRAGGAGAQQQPPPGQQQPPAQQAPAGNARPPG